MREIRPSGSEGGVARTRHPYPYQKLAHRNKPLAQGAFLLVLLGGEP
jgi:hypothetical protein